MLREDKMADELRRWRERRGRKPGLHAPECRNVKVNGREIVVIVKAKRQTV